MASPLDHLMDHDCERCALHLTTDRVCVGGDGDPESKIMILGEAPGEAEERTGRVFAGRAGQLLDQSLTAAGLRRSDCYVSNVVKCRPPDNARPDRKHQSACAMYLEREAKSVNPTHVLLLGNSALQAVARKSGITRQRGVRLAIKDPLWARRTVMATIHPAYVLRNPGQHSLFQEDVRRFVRAIRGDFQVVPVGATLVNTADGLRKLRRILEKADTIAYDVENRYAPWHPEWQLLCLGVSVDGERGFCVPLDHPSSPFRAGWRKVLRYLYPALNRHGVRLVAQNGKHDNIQLAGAGIFLEHSFDIMLAAHLLDENRPKNLGFLSQTLLGADEYKGMVETKPDKILDVPLKQLARYNAIDTGYTWQIRPKLKKELLEYPRLTRLFSKLMMPASHVIQQVEWVGMFCDQDRLWDRVLKTEQLVEDQLEVLGEYNPDHQEFNYNSPQQLGRWLFSGERRGGLGLSPMEHTATGMPSTKEAVLLHYRGHPAVQALLKYRTYQLKWLNTYLYNWVARLDARSRLHTIYKLYGTVTGRISGDMQQVPRDPFIRSILGAPHGWKWITADYSQVELRIAAHVADEQRMQRAFLLGEDLHTVTARQILGTAELTSEQRKKAKAVNFGFLYGMGAWKFQQYAFENYDMEVSDGEAKLYRQRFFETFPDLRTWHNRQERIVKSRGWVQSPIGRVRHLPDVLSSDRGVQQEAVRQAINSPVQSCASDLMLYSMVKLKDELDPRECYMVGTLHDGIFFQCRADSIGEYGPLIKQVMENLPIRRTFGTELAVPLVADVEYGQHWGEPEDVIK